MRSRLGITDLYPGYPRLNPWGILAPSSECRKETDVRVTLIDYTGMPDPWRAADLLIFTKNTRIKMTPDGLREIAGWPEERKRAELDYMANTIRSSWEFIDYCWMLEDVTRALTHQLVRHRTGSYAQQTQQVLRIDARAVVTPSGLSSQAADTWGGAVETMAYAYDEMIARGATVEQARGILPTNIKTNIVVKFNLRTLVDVIHQRVSPRNLGEFRDVAIAMRDSVLEVHPWTEVFLASTRDRAMLELDVMIQSSGLHPEARTRMHKLVDQLRRS